MKGLGIVYFFSGVSHTTNAQSIFLSEINKSIFLKSVVQNGIMLKISLNMM